MEPTREIKTCAAPGMPSKAERVKDLTQALQKLTVTDLKRLLALFSPQKLSGLDKIGLVNLAARAMSFAAEEDFREWFFRLPLLTQKLLCRLTFDRFVPAKKLEKEFGLPLAQKAPGYSWQPQWELTKETGLDFPVYDQHGQAILTLPLVLQKVLPLWLVPPPGLKLEDCAADSAAGGAAGPVWDNSAEIADSLPLLCDAIAELFAGGRLESPYKCLRGFSKKDAGELRVSSAFKPFAAPSAEKIPDLIVDNADLTARFMLAMKNFSIHRPADGQEEVKALTQAFFSDKSRYKGYVNPPDRHSLEYNLLLDQAAKGSELFLNYQGDLPPSRKIFRDILLFCAKDGRTFDAGKTAGFIYRTFLPFTFFYHGGERYIKYRAEELAVDGIIYAPQYGDILDFGGALEYHLFVAPLFKAYCCLFASLGLLEITLAMPPLARILRKKARPISPYDSLKTFRVTEFGKWCLGLTEQRPERKQAEYQAIADKELLLVTVQGNSLERTIYLDRIGRKLGSNRWRVSLDSFIAGCVEPKQLEERIAKFKTLIDPAPAPHWLAFFEKILTRAGLFDHPLEGMLIYQLPSERSIAEELLRDGAFRALVHRAEKGILLVPEKNLKKFQAALGAHGILMVNGDSGQRHV
ncbi:MAG: hypothetical protein LBK63_07085 [Treponema sp.]|jgi:hypothetical protein|nr:hypothetical protein [Treponema sp.]